MAMALASCQSSVEGGDHGMFPSLCLPCVDRITGVGCSRLEGAAPIRTNKNKS